MKPVKPVLAALCLAAAFVQMGSWTGSAVAQDLKEITVILPNPSALNVWPMHAAIGEGYMEEEGISVTVQAVDGSSLVLQALAAGQAQIGLPGPAPVLAARARGEDVVFIYNLNPKSIFGVVVREEFDVPAAGRPEGQGDRRRHGRRRRGQLRAQRPLGCRHDGGH